VCLHGQSTGIQSCWCQTLTHRTQPHTPCSTLAWWCGRMAREIGVLVKTDALTGQQQHSCLVAQIYVVFYFALFLKCLTYTGRPCCRPHSCILCTSPFHLGMQRVWMPGLNPLSRHRRLALLTDRHADQQVGATVRGAHTRRSSCLQLSWLGI